MPVLLVDMLDIIRCLCVCSGCTTMVIAPERKANVGIESRVMGLSLNDMSPYRFIMLDTGYQDWLRLKPCALLKLLG
jgi:hypothetical protein